MLMKIIIGFFALTGFVDMCISVIIRLFPESKAAKFIFKNFSMKIDLNTYKRIE